MSRRTNVSQLKIKLRLIQYSSCFGIFFDPIIIATPAQLQSPAVFPVNSSYVDLSNTRIHFYRPLNYSRLALNIYFTFRRVSLRFRRLTHWNWALLKKRERERRREGEGERRGRERKFRSLSCKCIMKRSRNARASRRAPSNVKREREKKRGYNRYMSIGQSGCIGGCENTGRL